MQILCALYKFITLLFKRSFWHFVITEKVGFYRPMQVEVSSGSIRVSDNSEQKIEQMKRMRELERRFWALRAKTIAADEKHSEKIEE